MDYNSSNVMIISKIIVNLRLNQQLKYIIAKNCVLPFKKWVYLNHEGRCGLNSGSRTNSNSKGKLYLLHDPASGSIYFVSAGKQWRNCRRGNYI